MWPSTARLSVMRHFAPRQGLSSSARAYPHCSPKPTGRAGIERIQPAAPRVAPKHRCRPIRIRRKNRMSTQPTPWLANPAMQKILAPLLVGAFLLGLWQALCVGLEVVLGVAAAFLFVQSRIIEASLFPYAILLQVTPVVAIAPLIIIWVSNTTLALVICATLVAIFPVISNTVLGLRSVNPGLLNLFRLNRASPWQALLRLRIPQALPYFFGGLRTC